MFVESTALQVVHDVVESIGIPAVCATIAWAVRTYDRGQQELKSIMKNSEATAAKVLVVDQKLDTIKDNHLAHLQAGIESVAETNTEAVKVLSNIDKGIAILVDRGPRV